MLGRVRLDGHLRRLLRPLMSVRHAHLRPLEAVTSGASRLSLHYGEAPACVAGCEGLWGAVQVLHDAGLWVGDLSDVMAVDDAGRVVLSRVGTTWDLSDPFSEHPSAGPPDLRIRWRQRADREQLSRMSELLTRCA